MKYLNKKIMSLVLLNFILLGLNIMPTLALAEENKGYQLLEPSVILDNSNGAGQPQPAKYGLQEYLKTAYLVLFVVVISAVIFYFILGGLEYILSDLPSAKLGGKDKLQKALFGLAIALSSVLLLQLINPDLLKFDLKLGESVAVSGDSH
jgi:hypothetical protein